MTKLSRAEQIDLMETAADRYEAFVERMKKDPVIKALVKSPPGSKTFFEPCDDPCDGWERIGEYQREIYKKADPKERKG